MAKTMSIYHNIWLDKELEYDEIMQTADYNQVTTIVRQHSKSKIYPRGYEWQIVWHNVLLFIVLHAITGYGFYLEICGNVQMKTIIFMLFIGFFGIFGITVGAHRLWSHRCFKARLPLRILLAVFQTFAMQNHIHEWVRDHRVHHKFTDTDADPYNSTRGFFFSHIGWLILRKHPDVASKGKTISLKDLEADPVVMFQKKYYLRLVATCIVITSFIPYWFWHESLWYSFVIVGVKRYVWTLHVTWLVNSIAHMWGAQPYDTSSTPKDNWIVALFAFGEGWHNYHHAFPWDYKAAELGNYRLNFSTAFIDMFARLGLAYDLKTASSNMVENRIHRTGVGSKGEQHGSIVKNEDDKNGKNVYVAFVFVVIYYAYVLYHSK